MPRRNNLYQDLVNVSTEYLGPAGERFVRRQISTHLNKEPEQLTKSDLNNLLDWFKLAFALLTENVQLVDEYSKRLQALTDQKRS